MLQIDLVMYLSYFDEDDKATPQTLDMSRNTKITQKKITDISCQRLTTFSSPQPCLYLGCKTVRRKGNNIPL